MKLIGLTGGIGMGKSTAATLLEQRGVSIVDTDRIARQLTEPGRPALSEIAVAFGPSVLCPDGALDRAALAQRVFADPAKRAKLEAILHPKIRQVWTEETQRWRVAGRDLGAVVIPLLYETKAENLFDAVVCVACSAAEQQRRLGERGWSRAEIHQRLAAQWPAEEKIALADFVIWTDTSLEAHAAQWERVLSIITNAAPAVP